MELFVNAMIHLTLALTLLVLVPAFAWASRCHFNQNTGFLDCASRGLTSVPTGERHFRDAIWIDLSANNISEIPSRMFESVTKLQSLDLSYNVIHSFGPAAFVGLGQLETLNLSDNHFTFTPEVLTSQLFEPLVSLSVLRIQRYKKSAYLSWRGIDKSFSKLTNLTALVADFPMDFIFHMGFRSLTKLTSIDASGRLSAKGDCDIGTLRNTTFRALSAIPVKNLRLINCAICSIEADAFEPLTTLRVLDLTYNNCLGLRPALNSLYGLQRRNMTEIKLVMLNNASSGSMNYHLATDDFKYLQTICTKAIDLSENFLSLLDASFKPIYRTDCLEKFNISYHSFRSVPWTYLLSFLEAEVLTTMDVSKGYGIPKYNGYSSHWMSGTKASTAPNISPLIPIPPTVVSANLSAIGVWLYMDHNITIRGGSNLKTLDISYNNLDNCVRPWLHGLENLTQLDISGTLCKRIPPEFFKTMLKLTHLSLSNSAYMHMVLNSPISPFGLLEVLEEVDLSGNKLFHIHPGLFSKNQALRIVNLANNKLIRLPSAILDIRHLHKLDLSWNDLTHLFPQEMRVLDRLMTKQAEKVAFFMLLLSGNPLQCICGTVGSVRWILQRKSHLDHHGNYSCFMSNGTRGPMYKFGEDITNFEVKCISQPYLTISVLGTLILLLLVLLCAAIYRYRSNIRYWLYTRLKPPDKMFDDQEFVYDAFVAYTSGDYDWVTKEFCTSLETPEEPFRLCIHDRDFIPGKPIHENIVDNMKQSRKVVLVITMDFIRSTYGPLEIEYAGMKCLEEGRDDIIVCILREDIPVRQMPRALRNLWHKITFLKWSSDPQEQAIFWRNLKAGLR